MSILSGLNMLNVYDDARRVIAVREDGQPRRKATGMVSLDWETVGLHLSVDAGWTGESGAAMHVHAFRNALDEGGGITVNGVAMDDCDIDITVERKSLRTYVIVYSLEYVDPQFGIAHDIDLLARVKLVKEPF